MSSLQLNGTSLPLFEYNPTDLYFNSIAAAPVSSTQYMNFSHNLQTTTIPATTPFGLALNDRDGDGETQLHRFISSRDAGLVEKLLFDGVAVGILRKEASPIGQQRSPLPSFSFCGYRVYPNWCETGLTHLRAQDASPFYGRSVWRSKTPNQRQDHLPQGDSCTMGKLDTS